MRFSIRHLLLIFPAFFIATLVASLVPPNSAVTYKFSDAYGDARRIASKIDYVEQTLGVAEIPTETINKWLGREIDELSPDAQGLDDHVSSDPWDHRYRCVRRFTSPDGRFHSVGIYSLGRDGISNSFGNDPDDLNSWNPNCKQMYIQECRSQKRLSYALDGALLTPHTFLGLLGCLCLIGRLWHWRRAC